MQSYSSWELLLIDDGSVDGTTDICEDYIHMDSRIKLYKKENGGVSSARNVGLEKASGTYVVFVDSDDWVLPDYIKHLVDGIFQYDVQFVMGYSMNISKESCVAKNYPVNLVDDRNWEKVFVENLLHNNTSPWCKIYDLSLIRKHGLCFNEKMHIGEDALFLFQYLMVVDRALLTNNHDYCYVYDSEGSLTKRIFSVESEFMSYVSISNILDRFKKIRNITSLKALECLDMLKASYVRRVLNSLYYNHTSIIERIKIYRQLHISLYIKVYKVDSVRERILQILLKYNLFLFYDIVRLLSIKIKNICKQ